MRQVICIFFILQLSASINAQVGINTTTPDASSILEIQSTDKGILIPRMTDVQRIAISGPANGLMVYETTAQKFWYYNGSIWVDLSEAFTLLLIDTDNDTQVQVEKNPDDDTIRFDIAGIERWSMQGKQLTPQNSGNSIFIGDVSGDNDDLTDNKNVYVGYKVGVSNISGENNIGIGGTALANNTASNNIGIGSNALVNNDAGQDNIAIGTEAMYQNDSGYFNVAYGSQSLRNNTTGYNNVAIGAESLFNNNGNDNTAVGFRALYTATATTGSTAMGYEAMFSNTTGLYNTAVGYWAMRENIIGSYNTANGYEALYNSDSSFNTAMGYQALYGNGGEKNTALGFKALYNSGTDNTAVGYGALENSFGDFQVAVGDLALNQNSTGSNNTAVGKSSLEFNTDGSNNVSIGAFSQYLDNGGYDIVAVGFQSLYKNKGFANVAVGKNSLYNNTDGFYNTAIGTEAMLSNTTGNYNTAVGYLANSIINTLDNSTGIGYNANPTVSNSIVIGDTNITSIGGQVAFTTLSDGRFKKNIKENVIGIDFIMKLKPITYNYDANAIASFKNTPEENRSRENEALMEKEVQSGFIAQDVEQVANEVGYNFHGVDAPKNKESSYGLRYAEFVVPLVKGMQEQQEEISKLKKKISVLENQLVLIKSRLKNKQN